MSFITGTSASNITAVGTGDINTGGTNVAESVAFHFNGTAWSEMTIPAGVELGPLTAFSATNLWSVNDNGDAEHFNGKTWTNFVRFDPSRNEGSLTPALSCPKVGFCVEVDGNPYAFTFNGKSWSRATKVDPGGSLDLLSCADSRFCVWLKPSTTSSRKTASSPSTEQLAASILASSSMVLSVLNLAP